MLLSPHIAPPDRQGFPRGFHRFLPTVPGRFPVSIRPVMCAPVRIATAYRRAATFILSFHSEEKINRNVRIIYSSPNKNILQLFTITQRDPTLSGFKFTPSAFCFYNSIDTSVSNNADNRIIRTRTLTNIQCTM